MAYQRYLTYLREAQAAQDAIDKFDLRTEDEVSVNRYKELVHEADKENLALIGLVLSQNQKIVFEMLRIESKSPA